MGTSCRILSCLSGKEKNLKMQAVGLGMCPVIIHVTQEREFRLCFVTLGCGVGRSSQENHTCLQGNKLSNQNSESKEANLPSVVSPHYQVDNVQLLRNTVLEVWPLSGEWDLDGLLELSQPEDSSSDHHARQLTFCFILFGDWVSLCRLGWPPTLHLLVLACWALELQALRCHDFFKKYFLKNEYTYAKLTCF